MRISHKNPIAHILKLIEKATDFMDELYYGNPFEITEPKKEEPGPTAKALGETQ